MQAARPAIARVQWLDTLGTTGARTAMSARTSTQGHDRANTAVGAPARPFTSHVFCEGGWTFVLKPLDIAPSKPHSGVMPFRNSGEVRALFRNPKGIESSSPGLRGTSYPGLRMAASSTPKGLRLLADAKPQPRSGCFSLTPFPRVARPSQPWALSRNPFGIRSGDCPKASHLGGM